MEEINLCKGHCGNGAIYAGWCGVKWKKGNRVSVTCPEIEKRRRKSISAYRLKESELGLNPMQNPEVCKKNHNPKRNKKVSETLKKLGRLHLLPQQTESTAKNLLRLTRIRKVLQKLSAEGKLNVQTESLHKKKLRHKRISETLKAKVKNGTYRVPTFKKIQYISKNNGVVYFRSNWELLVAQFLDGRYLPWSYETFNFPYWDPSKKEIRYTVPDFFLPKPNLFIEVKSNWKRISDASIPKIKGIRDAGYPVLVWKEREIDSIKSKKNRFIIISN